MKISLDAAMRARDVSAPSAADDLGADVIVTGASAEDRSSSHRDSRTRSHDDRSSNEGSHDGGSANEASYDDGSGGSSPLSS
jgi:hypothetical protein